MNFQGGNSVDGMLRGKTSIITGSNRGIGRAILGKFAEQGSDIFACARTENPEFEEDIKDLSDKYGVEIFPIYFDFEDKESMLNAVKKIRSYNKDIDVLINNAGILSEYQLFTMISVDKVRKLFDVDYFAQMEFTQYIARLMQRKKTGSITFISSIASLDAFFSSYDYAACKAAINISVTQMARELGAQGIRVNAIAPGVIETDMIKDVDQTSKESLLPAIYLNRYGTKDDVANAVLFISSELAAYITGQIIRVDGGIAPPRARW